VYREHAAEFHALIEAADDPWFHDLRVYVDVAALRSANQLDRARAVLEPAQRHCEPPNRRAFCHYFHRQLADIYLVSSQVEQAQRHTREALALARAEGQWHTHAILLRWMGDALRLARRLDLARAYMEESAQRDPYNCRAQRDTRIHMATGYINQGQYMKAVPLMEEAPRCADDDEQAARIHLQAASVYADLAALTGDSVYDERARAMLVRARAGHNPGDELIADQIAGRLALARTPARGRLLLREIIARVDRLGEPDPQASKVRAHSYGLLITDAMERHDLAGALSLFQEEARLAAEDGCVLALSRVVEDSRVLVLTRGGDGLLRSYQYDFSAQAELAAQWEAPGPVVSALRGCGQVDVLARPLIPLSGTLLPATIPWRM
ncbi:MAG: hypothetical protein AAGC55_32590, partial [Myxococcota bacterium]